MTDFSSGLTIEVERLPVLAVFFRFIIRIQASLFLGELDPECTFQVRANKMNLTGCSLSYVPTAVQIAAGVSDMAVIGT